MPMVPLEVVALDMIGVAGRVVRARVREAVPAPFEAETVMVALPVVVGTPLISPLVAFKVSPLGRLAAPYNLARFVAVMR